MLATTDHARVEVQTALQPLIGSLQELARSLTDEQARVVLRFLQQAADIHADYAVVDAKPGQSTRSQAH